MGRTPSDRRLTPSHGSDAVKPPTPPSHLKASGKRTWKRLWEVGQVWLGPPDEPAVKAVCEQVDQIADLRGMAVQVERPELEQKYLHAIQAAERSLMSSLSELGFTPVAQDRLGFTVSQVAEAGSGPRRRGRRRTTETTRE